MAALWRIVSQKWNLPFEENTSFAGKTVLITGTTIGGLGFEAAQKIAALDPTKLIITARSEKKGQAAKEQIERYIQSRKGSGRGASPEIEIYTLDMDDFSNVKAFAEKVNANIAELHAVILNAGVTNRAWSMTREGWEQTLQVNTISTALLALLLLPKLLSSGDTKNPTHLNFISSGSARLVKPEKVRQFYDSPNALQAMSAEKAWLGGMGHYALSKLLLEYAMRHIAMLPSVVSTSGEPKVIVNSVCPGMCKTDLGRQYTDKSLLYRILLWIMSLLIMRSAEAGSREYVSAITRGKESQGKLWKDDRYFDGGEMVESAEGKKFGEKIWKEMVGVMESIEPKVESVLAAN
jgi:NAD(P)-dependent dehydrogenase (short-subunit alcohol dehydrogenase family)